MFAPITPVDESFWTDKTSKELPPNRNRICVDITGILMTLAEPFIRGGKRALDFSPGVKSTEVLNSGTAIEKSNNPAKAMMKARKALLANGVNPNTGLVDHLDPRIHFSLFCGARSCPAITFYDPEHLDKQLDQAAAAFINGDGLLDRAETNTIPLTKIFQWYQPDFGGLPSILKLVQHHVHDQEARKVLESGDFRVRYMRYDWEVNAGNELLR